MFFLPHVLGTLLAVTPTPAPSSQPSAPPQIAHVYTADRHAETLKNAARTIYVVTHDQIVRYGYRTVAEALETVPGVEISPYGALGSSVSFGVRGSGSSEVLVLVDGFPAPGSFSDTVELGNLPTTGVDRIEVVEGGGSTLYGTGAIGGIINIITQRSARNGATARYGSFGDKELYVESDHVQFSRVLATNGFSLPDASTRTDSDYASSALHVDGERRIGAFKAALLGSFESDHLGAPGPTDFLSPTSRENDVNEDANLALTHKTAQAQATLQLGGTTQMIQFLCDPTTDPNCFLSYPALNREGRVEMSARNLVDGANEELQYGIDLSRGVVRSDSGGGVAPGTPAVATDALAQSAAYVQERFDQRWGNLYAGLRGERDGSLGGEYSPSAGFVLHLSNEASLKGNVANAFRAPNASELYFPGYGNPALLPERAKVADLTLVDTHMAGGASLGWFANRTDDLIAYDFTTSALDQIDHAFIEGLTFEVSTPVRHGLVTSFNLTDLYRAQNLDAQTRLSNDPVISANLRLQYAARAANLVDGWGLVMRMAGPRGSVNRALPLFDQPAEYSSLDGYLSLRASHALLVTLRGYNLGNERYAAVAGYPMPGRSFVLEVSTRRP